MGCRYQAFIENHEGDGTGEFCTVGTLRECYDFLTWRFEQDFQSGQDGTLRTWWVKDYELQTFAGSWEAAQMWAALYEDFSCFRFWIEERMCIPEGCQV